MSIYVVKKWIQYLPSSNYVQIFEEPFVFMYFLAFSLFSKYEDERSGDEDDFEIIEVCWHQIMYVLYACLYAGSQLLY